MVRENEGRRIKQKSVLVPANITSALHGLHWIGSKTHPAGDRSPRAPAWPATSHLSLTYSCFFISKPSFWSCVCCNPQEVTRARSDIRSDISMSERAMENVRRGGVLWSGKHGRRAQLCVSQHSAPFPVRKELCRGSSYPVQLCKICKWRPVQNLEVGVPGPLYACLTQS